MGLYGGDFFLAGTVRNRAHRVKAGIEAVTAMCSVPHHSQNLKIRFPTFITTKLGGAIENHP